MATITATEFQKHSGQYIEQSGKEPVFITKHKRPARVLMDFEQYEQLIALERKHYLVEDLPNDIVTELDKGFQGEGRPYLDHLMD